MILIALGANLPSRFGSPYQTLQSAKRSIENQNISILNESRTWLTAPVPVSDQPWYHNEVIAVATELSPFALLEALQGIENEFGRVRTVRNAPRVLDLDLIAYNDVILDKPELIVPHPRMQQRAFVLRPLSDITETWYHPLTGQNLKDMLMRIPADQEATPMEEKELLSA